jgi:hypothetical protein
MYDNNHGKPCEVCCLHDKGWWLLKEHYGKDNGKWCCKAGCGFTVRMVDNIGDLFSAWISGETVVYNGVLWRMVDVTPKRKRTKRKHK